MSKPATITRIPSSASLLITSTIFLIGNLFFASNRFFLFSAESLPVSIIRLALRCWFALLSELLAALLAFSQA